MQAEYHMPARTLRSREGRGFWLWKVLDAQGLEVDSGRTADQASAVRHARRSALQRNGDYSIAVSHQALEQSALIGRPHT